MSNLVKDARNRSFEFDTSSEDFSMLQDMLGDLGAENKWNQDPDSMLDAMTKIAFHETGGSLDPSQMQYGGGPGRGLFQYETGEGEGAHTAINRITRYFEGKDGKGKVPEWISSINADSNWDVSSLSPSQQYMLFLADKAKDSTAHMRDIDEEGGVRDLWEKEHWAGHKYDEGGNLLNQETVQSRLNSFNESMGVYKDTMLDQILGRTNKEGE